MQSMFGTEPLVIKAPRDRKANWNISENAKRKAKQQHGGGGIAQGKSPEVWLQASLCPQLERWLFTLVSALVLDSSHTRTRPIIIIIIN